MRIGIVGFSSPHFDQLKAKIILETILNNIITDIDKKEVEIVSGYTNVGISKIAYEIADSIGLKTVGFSAKRL